MQYVGYAELDQLVGEVLPTRTLLSTMTSLSEGAAPSFDPSLNLQPICAPEPPSEPYDLTFEVHPRCEPEIACNPGDPRLDKYPPCMAGVPD